MDLPKIIIVLGPTATGKSDLAVKLAKDFDGEIVSADSRQVYKGLDIGSGKITKKEMKGVSHHLLDIVSPRRTFNVMAFQKKAYRAIDDILKRGKTPIIVGGTGFYIQSIVDGIVLPEIKPNKILRKKLGAMTLEKLGEKLKKMDSERYEKIDLNNKMRVIRAIEIATSMGKVPKVSKKPQYQTLQIGIKLPSKDLNRNIARRLNKRMKQGMVKEVQNLHTRGLSWKRMEELGLEYRYLAQYLQGDINMEKLLSEIQIKSQQFAKRQMTWFQRDKRIQWYSPKEYSKIKKEVQNYI